MQQCPLDRLQVQDRGKTVREGIRELSTNKVTLMGLQEILSEM